MAPGDAANGHFPAPVSRVSRWLGVLLLAPPLLLAGVRMVLQEATDRASSVAAWSLTPVSAPSGWLDLIWPALAVVALLALPGLVLIRLSVRLGWRRLRPAALLLWVAAWLAGSGALIERHLNQQTLQAQPSVVAVVLGRQIKPASARGVGGVVLFLQVPALTEAQRVLIDDLRLQQILPGARLQLTLARGRWHGLFVTGWQSVPAAPGSL